MAPNEPHLLVFMQLCNPLPLNMNGINNLFILANRIWQRWLDITLIIGLHKIETCVLLADSLYCFLGLYTLVKQPFMLEKPMWQETVRVSVAERQGTEALSPTTTPGQALRWVLGPCWHFHPCLVRKPGSEDSAMPGLHSNWDKIVCCFKLQSFVVICYT